MRGSGSRKTPGMSSKSTKSKVSDANAQLACSRNPITPTGVPLRAMSSNGTRKAWPSADATSRFASPSRCRRAMWASMSLSTSLSSSTFGLAKTAKPTLRSASTQGRTTSALPAAILVNTVASGSSVIPGYNSDRSAVRFSSHRPRASNRGRWAAVGLPPRMEPRPMSRLGASHTSSTRMVAGSCSTAGGASMVSWIRVMVVSPTGVRSPGCPRDVPSSRTS